MIPKNKPYNSKKWRSAARGEPCTMNSQYCNYNNETVVMCHLNEQYAGKGIGQKADDIASFYGCSGCHTAYDGGKIGADDVLRAVIKTIFRRREQGLINVR